MDASVGEAIEEFMHFAEGLKHQTAKGTTLIALASPGVVGVCHIKAPASF
jgi:hypothetical protein